MRSGPNSSRGDTSLSEPTQSRPSGISFLLCKHPLLQSKSIICVIVLEVAQERILARRGRDRRPSIGVPTERKSKADKSASVLYNRRSALDERLGRPGISGAAVPTRTKNVCEVEPSVRVRFIFPFQLVGRRF